MDDQQTTDWAAAAKEAGAAAYVPSPSKPAEKVDWASAAKDAGATPYSQSVPKQVDWAAAVKESGGQEAVSPVPGMERLGGVPPGAPTAPLPIRLSKSALTDEESASLPFIEGKTAHQSAEFLRGQKRFDSGEPTRSPLVQGPIRMVQGGGKLVDAAKNRSLPIAAEGASDVIGGAFDTLSPLVPVGLAEAAVPTIASLALGSGAAMATDKALEAFDVRPEYRAFASDIAAILAGGKYGMEAMKRLHVAAGSPEVKIGGAFPTTKPFAEMTDAELGQHAAAITADPPKNYEWQVEQIKKEAADRVLKKQAKSAEGGIPSGQPTVIPEATPSKPTPAGPVVSTPPEASTVDAGSTYKTENGTIAVTKVFDGKVTFDQTMPDGEVMKGLVLPVARFQRAVVPPKTATPVEGPTTPVAFPEAQIATHSENNQTESAVDLKDTAPESTSLKSQQPDVLPPETAGVKSNTVAPQEPIQEQQVDGVEPPVSTSTAQNIPENIPSAKSEPPVASGFTRMYHGGSPDEIDGSRWFSSDRRYAEGYASKSPDGIVRYVDIPTDHPLIEPEWADQSIARGFHHNVELPAEIATKAKPLNAAATKEVEPTEPAGLTEGPKHIASEERKQTAALVAAPAPPATPKEEVIQPKKTEQAGGGKPLHAGDQRMPYPHISAIKEPTALVKDVLATLGGRLTDDGARTVEMMIRRSGMSEGEAADIVAAAAKDGKANAAAVAEEYKRRVGTPEAKATADQLADYRLNHMGDDFNPGEKYSKKPAPSFAEKMAEFSKRTDDFEHSNGAKTPQPPHVLKNVVLDMEDYQSKAKMSESDAKTFNAEMERIRGESQESPKSRKADLTAKPTTSTPKIPSKAKAEAEKPRKESAILRLAKDETGSSPIEPISVAARNLFGSLKRFFDGEPEPTIPRAAMPDWVKEMTDSLAASEAPPSRAKPAQAGLEPKADKQATPAASEEFPTEIKPSKLALGVEEKAIENRLTTGFEGRPEYQTMNVKEQAEKASKLLKDDPYKAIQIAMGQELPANDLTPEAVFVAVENHATETADVDLLRRLAEASSLSLEATHMGQRIRMLAERNPNSPVALMQEVVTAREAASVKRNGPTKQARDKVKKEIKEAIKTANKQKEPWSVFLEKIKCQE